MVESDLFSLLMLERMWEASRDNLKYLLAYKQTGIASHCIAGKDLEVLSELCGNHGFCHLDTDTQSFR